MKCGKDETVGSKMRIYQIIASTGSRYFSPAPVEQTCRVLPELGLCRDPLTPDIDREVGNEFQDFEGQ